MTTKQRALGNALESGVVRRAKAKGLEARRQPRSGELPEYPADAVVEGLLAECKVRAVALDARGARHIPLDLDWLYGVQDQARRAGFRAGVVVMRPKGSEKLLALLDFDLLLDLLKVDRKASGRL